MGDLFFGSGKFISYKFDGSSFHRLLMVIVWLGMLLLHILHIKNVKSCSMAI
jgi:hypothetical protein